MAFIKRKCAEAQSGGLTSERDGVDLVMSGKWVNFVLSFNNKMCFLLIGSVSY